MMSAIARKEVNPENRRRLEAPKPKGWARSVRPNDAKPKYVMASVDSQLIPPPKLFHKRRAMVLGLNAAGISKFDAPASYRA